MNIIFWTCRSRRVGSFQRKQRRKEKKALKTLLYCDRFFTLTFDCWYATTLWKNVFRSKVVARKLKSLRPTSPWRLADPCINYIKPPPCVTTSYHPPPIQNLTENFNAAFFCLGAEFNLGRVALFLPPPMVFTYGVNLTLNRVNTGISIQQKPEVHIYWIVLQNKASNLCNIQGLHCLSIVRL